MRYAEQRDFAQAIADFSQAIELDPSNLSAYGNRGLIHQQRGELVQAIPDILRCNQDGNSNNWDEWTPRESEYNRWCQEAHRHFVYELLPKTKQTNEIVLQYWPATFFWGESEHQQYHDDKQRLYTHRTQSAARGYICVTSNSVYVVLRGDITKDYSIKGPGFLQNIISKSLLDQYDELYQEKSDRVIIISNKSIRGIELSDDIIILHTPSDTWHIISLFNSDNCQYIYVALSLAFQGQLIPTKVEAAKVESTNPEIPSEQPAVKSTSLSEIKAILKTLAEWKAEGLINEEEYQAKKKELLARI